MRDQYVRQGEGFLVVFALNSRDSFDSILGFKDLIVSIKGDEIPMILCGNKSDLLDEREIPFSEAKNLADSLHIPYFETSAFSGAGIEGAFFECVREIRKRQLNDPNKDSSSSNHNKKKNKMEKLMKLCYLL